MDCIGCKMVEIKYNKRCRIITGDYEREGIFRGVEPFSPKEILSLPDEVLKHVDPTTLLKPSATFIYHSQHRPQMEIFELEELTEDITRNDIPTFIARETGVFPLYGVEGLVARYHLWKAGITKEIGQKGK